MKKKEIERLTKIKLPERSPPMVFACELIGEIGELLSRRASRWLLPRGTETRRGKAMAESCETPVPPGPEFGAGLQGGQLWAQEVFPFCRCVLVYLEGDRFCRIAPPSDGAGVIAIAGGSGQVIYSAEEMRALLERWGYKPQGPYVDAGRVQRQRGPGR